MRSILLALVATLGVSGGALAAEWVEIVAGKNRRVEIDKASILQSDPGTKVAWGRIVMTDEEVAQAGYKSVKALNRYDCRQGTFSTIKRVYLDSEQHLLREERVVEPKIIKVAPGSVDDRLFREVCQPPTATQLAQLAEDAASAAEQAAAAPATATAAAVADVTADSPEPPPAHTTETETERSIVPRFVRPLTEAQKQAAVQARLSAIERASARKVSDAHGSEHATPAKGEDAHAAAKAASHAPTATVAHDAVPTRKVDSHSETAPARTVTRHAEPVKPKVVLARAAPTDAHGARATKASTKRSTAKPSEPDLSHIHWDYTGLGGPDNWGKLKPEFATCGSGNRQSPIDINDGIRVDLAPIEFNYLPSYFRIVDNGHTVQVNLGTGSTIRVMGRTYDLLQFHFHRPSEFRIGGRGYDMEAHLVHQDLDGRLAVVSVMLERGTAHPIVQTLWNNLPLEQQTSYAPEIVIDPNELLPVDRRYATFMGSLTTPPCTEGVMWMVMRQPVQVSVEQISIFSRLHPMNARPLQDMAGRLIKMSR